MASELQTESKGGKAAENTTLALFIRCVWAFNIWPHKSRGQSHLMLDHDVRT